ncbi:MAG TPA: lipopolysaccharide heptosyltransferase II [Porticoccaceae bacterium]|nr:lipopolysaccharide heptosyltransferase II [Porticoccaceae bacterium]
MVMAQTLFILLKRKFPESPLEVLAPAWSKPILKRMPEVAAAVIMPVGHGELAIGKRWRIAQTLRARNYRAAYVLPNSFKSALIPMFAGIPERVGWRGEMRFGLINDIRLLDEERYPLMVERFAALAFEVDTPLPDPLPRPRLSVNSEAVNELLARFQLDLSRAVAVLCPGAEFGPAKRWPARHYRRVAEAWVARGGQAWILGSDNDAVVGAEVCTGLEVSARPHVHNLAGNTVLAEAVDLMACAAVVVSNDSGLMHIAAALDRPLVAVYGSSSPAFTPPLAEHVEILSVPVDCGPCFQRECPLGHLKCLNDLAPETVLAAIDRLAALGQVEPH